MERISSGAGFGTLSVWGGEEGLGWWNATQVPIVRSVGFAYETVGEWLEVARGKVPGHIYSRNTNPTVDAFEEKVRRLEGAEAATSFSSGMAAIAGTLFTLLKPGSRVVALRGLYGGTSRILVDHLPPLGVEVSLCDGSNTEVLEAAIRLGCDVVYIETPNNPLFQLVDIERAAKAAREVGAVLVTDSTLASPLNQNPLALGSDLVIHSATKFLGGHGDTLGGVVCGSKELIHRIFSWREITGAVLTADSAYLLLRSIKTLQLRIERQNESALRIASFLEAHPAVQEVYYPGLRSHPQHELAKRQMRGFGGVMSFMVAGGFDQVQAFLEGLRIAHLSASLGHVETFAGPPATTSHVECSPEQRAELGIPENLIRYSVGIEDCDDLIADIEQALVASQTIASA